MFKPRINKIYLYRRTLWDMAFNQLKAKYAGSRLGIWWAVIIPLLLALSINFVFNAAFKITIPNYTFYVLAGIIPWFFFTGALTEATGSFIANAPLLKQSTLPREFIPVSCILANLLNFLIGLIFLLPLFVFINVKVIWLLPFLLFAILLHFVFLLGLGFIFSTVNIFFRDLAHFLQIGFMIWFWITPVFYSLDMVDFPFRWICLLNPMSYFVTLYQNILSEARLPNPLIMAVAFSISILSYAVGHAVFIRKEKAFLKII